MSRKISMTLSLCLIAICTLTAVKCTNEGDSGKPTDEVEVLKPKVIQSYNHDSFAFTQGLVYDNGVLYESTGQYGQSSVRKVDLATGKVLSKFEVDKQYFAEGLTLFKGQIIQLTWKARKVFVYGESDDQITIKQTKQLSTGTEGWGLTHDGKSLILSDGSSRIYFINPDTDQQERTIDVTLGGAPVKKLNELEYIDGEIYANVWQSNEILGIDPESGKVTKKIVVDLDALFQGTERTQVDDTDNVLNGIAWDGEKKRLFITGKNWPKLFHIELEAN
jgi:glutamine cyclotransferase